MADKTPYKDHPHLGPDPLPQYCSECMYEKKFDQDLSSVRSGWFVCVWKSDEGRGFIAGDDPSIVLEAAKTNILAKRVEIKIFRKDWV